MPKIDPLFDDLVNRGGSDLHIAAGYPPLARIRGDFVPLIDVVLDPKEASEMLLELLTPTQRGRLQVEYDLDLAHAHRDVARFRASFFLKTSGLGAVFRLVPTRVLSLTELGCPEVFWRLADRRSGLVLLSGPSGSGRTTTAAAMVDHINKTRACHILTIEDPIEFVHEPLRAQITHREIGVHASSFGAALRSARRENPDVVLVSDMRGTEATKLVLELASAGSLVLATTTATSTEAAIASIVTSFPQEEEREVLGLLAESLVGVVAQQLLRTVDDKGRIAVHEVLVGSPQVASLVREGKTGQLTSVMQTGAGMQTLDMALERLMTSGKITAEDALERAEGREAFARVVARSRPDLVDDGT